MSVSIEIARRHGQESIVGKLEEAMAVRRMDKPNECHLEIHHHKIRAIARAHKLNASHTDVCRFRRLFPHPDYIVLAIVRHRREQTAIGVLYIIFGRVDDDFVSTEEEWPKSMHERG